MVFVAIGPDPHFISKRTFRRIPITIHFRHRARASPIPEKKASLTTNGIRTQHSSQISFHILGQGETIPQFLRRAIQKHNRIPFNTIYPDLFRPPQELFRTLKVFPMQSHL